MNYFIIIILLVILIFFTSYSSENKEIESFRNQSGKFTHEII